VTIQWIGRKYASSGTGPAVEFQAILHDGTNVIDFIYGPGHMTDTTSATVGVENLLGFLAETIARNADGFSAAGTSHTLTPN